MEKFCKVFSQVSFCFSQMFTCKNAKIIINHFLKIIFVLTKRRENHHTLKFIMTSKLQRLKVSGSWVSCEKRSNMVGGQKRRKQKMRGRKHRIFFFIYFSQLFLLSLKHSLLYSCWLRRTRCTMQDI